MWKVSLHYHDYNKEWYFDFKQTDISTPLCVPYIGSSHCIRSWSGRQRSRPGSSRALCHWVQGEVQNRCEEQPAGVVKITHGMREIKKTDECQHDVHTDEYRDDNGR